MRGSVIQGLYAVTPDEADTQTLVTQVAAAIKGGARFVQYRNKTAAPALRREQALALKALCDAHGASLIINDHVELAHEVDAAGVHLGAEDGGATAARAELAAGKLIGISCYDRLDLARAAQAGGADYVAFGSFFASRIKPAAVRAPLALLAQARSELRVPIVAIGGITLDNARELVDSGAEALAVISAVFDAPDVALAARRFTAMFQTRA